jgi:hypothetical protein
MVQWIINTCHVSDLTNQHLTILCWNGIVVEYTSWHGDTNRNLFCVSHSADGNVNATMHVTRDFFVHIARNLILYDHRHLSPICDDNWEIVSNLKSGSMFECFLCFRGLRWEPIRIKFCHVDNAGRYLIATSLPPFSFVNGEILRFCRRWTELFRLGGQGHILLRIASLQIE